MKKVLISCGIGVGVVALTAFLVPLFEAKPITQAVTVAIVLTGCTFFAGSAAVMGVQKESNSAYLDATYLAIGVATISVAVSVFAYVNFGPIAIHFSNIQTSSTDLLVRIGSWFGSCISIVGAGTAICDATDYSGGEAAKGIKRLWVVAIAISTAAVNFGILYCLPRVI